MTIDIYYNVLRKNCRWPPMGATQLGPENMQY